VVRKKSPEENRSVKRASGEKNFKTGRSARPEKMGKVREGSDHGSASERTGHVGGGTGLQHAKK